MRGAARQRRGGRKMVLRRNDQLEFDGDEAIELDSAQRATLTRVLQDHAAWLNSSHSDREIDDFERHGHRIDMPADIPLRLADSIEEGSTVKVDRGSDAVLAAAFHSVARRPAGFLRGMLADGHMERLVRVVGERFADRRAMDPINLPEGTNGLNREVSRVMMDVVSRVEGLQDLVRQKDKRIASLEEEVSVLRQESTQTRRALVGVAQKLDSGPIQRRTADAPRPAASPPSSTAGADFD